LKSDASLESNLSLREEVSNGEEKNYGEAVKVKKGAKTATEEGCSPTG
jgi:hypothetical protein